MDCVGRQSKPSVKNRLRPNDCYLIAITHLAKLSLARKEIKAHALKQSIKFKTTFIQFSIKL